MPAPYTELQVTSHFSFLRGASSPEELFVAAHALGYSALGIADRGSLAGMVRAHQAANATGLRLVVGSRLDLEDAPPLPAMTGRPCANARDASRARNAAMTSARLKQRFWAAMALFSGSIQAPSI